MKTGSLVGVTWARRERTRSHASPGFRRVRCRTVRRVSRVTEWYHFLGREGDKVVVEGVVWMSGGEDILVMMIDLYIIAVLFNASLVVKSSSIYAGSCQWKKN